MRRSLLVALVSSFVIAGCDSTASPFEPTDGDIPLPKNTIEGDGSITELRNHQRVWLDAAINYRIAEQVNCFCGFHDPNPAVLEVRSGAITRAWDRRTGSEFTPTGSEKRTIEQLFEYAIAQAENGERIRVAYDARLRYPAILSIGEPERDAGVIYLLANFQRL